MDITGERLRALRKRRGMTLQDVSSLLKISINAIAMYERGERNVPTDKLRLLANFYGVSSAYLLGETDDERPMHARERNAELISLRRVPLVGRVVAGEPLLSEQNIEGDVPVPANIDCDFALTIVGDSMVGAGLYEGDIVFCVKAERRPPTHGDMVVALVNGIENTVKWLLRDRHGQWFLRADNPAYSDIPLKGVDDRVQAVVVASLRKTQKYEQ